MNGEKDWFENHELRISRLEDRFEKNDDFNRESIRNLATAGVLVENLREAIRKQESHLERQDEKLDKMGGNINKMLLGIAGTIIMMLAKLVLDLTMGK